MPLHKPMVNKDFTPPERVLTELFLVRPLLHADAAADYEAWSTSIEHLRGIFGPGSRWPIADMTLEENAIDLAWHQREHESGASFAYTVFDLSNERCLGCIYLSPARKLGYDAEAFYWVRASEVDHGLDEALGDFMNRWLSEAWPFKAVAFPGRGLDWTTYQALPDQPHW